MFERAFKVIEDTSGYGGGCFFQGVQGVVDLVATGDLLFNFKAHTGHVMGRYSITAALG